MYTAFMPIYIMIKYFILREDQCRLNNGGCLYMYLRSNFTYPSFFARLQVRVHYHSPNFKEISLHSKEHVSFIVFLFCFKAFL